MAYAVLADLELSQQRLIELTDSDQAHGVVDMAKVNRALDRATEKIDNKLLGKYVLPLSPVPGVVRGWCAEMAKYLLYRGRETMEVPSSVVDDYKRANAELDRVADGTDQLSSARVEAATPPAVTGGGLESIERRFGRLKDGLGT